jgi:MYXO-CTERM domain-containing protein
MAQTGDASPSTTMTAANDDDGDDNGKWGLAGLLGLLGLLGLRRRDVDHHNRTTPNR